MGAITDRLMHAWNAFTDGKQEPQQKTWGYYGGIAGARPDRSRMRLSNDRSIVGSIYNRIAIDVAAISILHVRLDTDKDNRYKETIKSYLNECLTIGANIDQDARAFKQDIAQTLCEKGYLAIVPVDTDLNPTLTTGYDILTMRVGEIVDWAPKDIKVRLYNEEVGDRQEIWVSKQYAAVVENPLYSVMNEPNSTLQRLIRKLALLDSIDEQAGSGKLDMIIQLPYVIKSEARREQAENRRKDIEMQLTGSKYGIAYTDGTERITQLNRPVENNLMGQIEFLTAQLYSQLGLTKEIFDGTASEAVMLNYYSRTIEPILTAITGSMKRAFLTKTGRSQGQSIEFYRDPFKLVPVGTLAEIADKFTRNEIMSSNEFRAIMGLKPSSDAKADQLVNSNMPTDKTGIQPGAQTGSPPTPPPEFEQ